MSELLQGKSLNWVCLDADGVCAVHTRDVLQNWIDQRSAEDGAKIHLHLSNHCTNWLTAESQKNVVSTITRGEISLLVIHVREPAELEPTCRLLAQISHIPRRVERVCSLAPELADWTPLMLEAGAQNVVGQLTFLGPTIARLLGRVPLSGKGYHPLTSGLMDKLPWQHLG